MSREGVLDRIVEYLCEPGNSLKTEEICRSYLKMPHTPAARNLVTSLLSQDPRLIATKDVWTLDADGVVAYQGIDQDYFYPLWLEYRLQPFRLTYLSVSTISGDSPTERITWTAPEDGQEQYSHTLPACLQRIKKESRGGILLFYSSRDERIFRRTAETHGITPPDNSRLVHSLFALSGKKMQGRKKGLAAVAAPLLSVESEPAQAPERARLFARLCTSLTKSLTGRGIITPRDLVRGEEQTSPPLWEKARFTSTLTDQLEERPGVYAFLDGKGTYLYIGKGENLRRRVATYFRCTDESPEKLITLRRNAVDFIHHYCGSNLEARILEHRLINRHAPRLNKQSGISGDTELFADPLILVLPASDRDHRQTIWYSPKQSKIIMKKLPISLPTQYQSALKEDMEKFFFSSPKAEPAPSQELFIVSRSLKNDGEETPRLDIPAQASSSTALSALLTALEDTSGQRILYR
ncbi:MAG: GIY-YIG nuclease family protein [Fibrobacterota bacterium]